MTHIHLTLGLRWITRLVGLLLVLFFVTFVIAHLVADGLPSPGAFTGGQAVYGIGLLALYSGLAVAWFRPKWGGFLSIAGWAVMRFPMDWPMLIPAAAGMTHLAVWWLLRDFTVIPPLPRWMALAIFAPLTVFGVLSANEILGQPPLMTGSARAVSGTWSDETTRLIIGQDSSVSGTIGADAVVGARIMANRTWFGRAMNWRTDYLIRGEELRIFLNAESGLLTGTVEKGKTRLAVRLRAS